MLGTLVHKLRRALVRRFLRAGRTVTIGGARYEAGDFFESRLALADRHEEWLDSAYAAALAAKEGAFLDIGVNLGQTLTKVLALDRDRSYVGFEPQLDCGLYVDRFLKRNGLSRHTLLPVGLSNRTGVATLLLRHDDADGTASTVEGFRPGDFYAARQSIFVVRGDDVLPGLELPAVSTVKIDVEGGELEVVEGLLQTLADHRPFVFFEVLNHFLVATGQALSPETIAFREERTRRLERHLRDLGYVVFHVLPDDRIAEIPEIRPRVSSDLRITDYVAAHADHRDAFLAAYQGTLLP